MSSKQLENNIYVNDGAENVECEYAPIYEKNSIEECVIINDEPKIKTTKDLSALGEKPGHKKSERIDEGLYDEISYDLDSPAQGVISQGTDKDDRKASSVQSKTGRGSKQNKMIIVAVVGVLLIGALAVGIGFSVHGR